MRSADLQLPPAAEHTVAVVHGPRAGPELGVRLLALVIEPSGEEVYRVSLRTSSAGALVAGVMTHVHGDEWDLAEDGASVPTRVTWASPDEGFALALGHGEAAGSPDVAEAAPRWPASVMDRLVRRRLSGPGTVALDASWFLAELATSALDHPMLLPGAASKLGLEGLERATAVLGALAARGHGASRSLVESLLTASDADRTIDDGLAWSGDGRLIGEFDGGELAQIGADIHEGCRAALGTGPLQVVFSPHEPLGLGLGPLVHADAADRGGGAHPVDSAGSGCVVGEVDPGGAAERAGVQPGMALLHLSSPHLGLSLRGPDALSFEAVLDAIDARRAAGGPLTVTFDTAAAATHLYAVEMPAAEALRALAADVGWEVQWRDVGVGASLDALCGGALLWREETPRLFVGEAGSLTCAHTDMCPQVQMAHALFGTKLLGVATHRATSRLLAEHGDSLEHEATSVPTDRRLKARAARLVCDPEVSVAVLQQGDLAVFDSGALHFASNGAEAMSGALYHGLVTPGAVPRLRLAAAACSGSTDATGDGYGDHLLAPELLSLVEQRLAGE